MKAYIDNIEYFVPKNRLSNEDLSKINPDWDVEKIVEKTGISNRYIASIKTRLQPILAVAAANKLLREKIQNW